MKNFKEVYELPFITNDCTGWVYDSKGNFVFQFVFDNSVIEHKILDVINGNSNLTNPELSFNYENGCIMDNDNVSAILIRGWGNLTGFLKLAEQDACNVQDSLGNYIVERLNYRE